MIRAIRRKVPVSDSVLLRLTVLIGLMVLLVGIGFVAPRVPPELVMIAVAAPPIVLLTLSRLEYGTLAVILTAAFVRFSLSTGRKDMGYYAAMADQLGVPAFAAHTVQQIYGLAVQAGSADRPVPALIDILASLKSER